MGLAGRKVKQRIGNDPRNLGWSADANRFGQAYLSKFGWDASQGLGASGEGRLTHIKVSQKLDMLGIGAASHGNHPDGIAWKQNKDFEALLKRLNANNAEDGDQQDVDDDKEERDAEGAMDEGEKKGAAASDEDKTEKKKRKKSKEKTDEIEDQVEGNNDNAAKSEEPKPAPSRPAVMR
jgi:Pin2-interacting protein X1